MQPIDELAEGGTVADDRRRLEELFHEHSQALLAYLLRRSEIPEDASDALAEVMLVAWRRLDDVPPGDEARLWLFGVARRVVANTRRSAERRLRLGDRLRREFAPAVAPGPEDEHEADVVRAAIRKLPEGQREVLLLNAWEGLEPAEIAAVTGVIPATARARLHRARKQLRRELESMVGGGPPGRGLPVMRRAREERT